MWTVGITHLVRPPFEPERRALGEGTRFVFFDSRDESGFDAAELRTLDALLVWTPAITRRTAQHLEKCRILVRYGVGYDKIDRRALEDRGIRFSNNPEYGPEDVADTAMAMLLSLQRRIYEHDQACRGYVEGWQEHHMAPTQRSGALTVGLVGVGRIGTSVVNRLKPFGHRILGYDPYVPTGHDRAIGYERVHDLDELFSRSDAVSLHCPLTDETRGMVDAERLGLMKSGAILVNTARGGLLSDLSALGDALRSGTLGAAGLDVLPHEPPVEHPLLSAWRDNEPWLRGRLIVNPHNAFYSEQSMWEARYKTAETARLFLDRGVHRNAVEGFGAAYQSQAAAPK